MLVGDKIKFVTLNNGEYLTLIGEVEKLGDNHTTILVLPKKVLAYVVPNKDIIDVVDIHREGYPEEYIKDFVESLGNDIIFQKNLIKMFTQGKCYLFADWLHKRLLFSKIVYVREDSHYVVKWDNKLYDITGEVTDKYKGCHLDEHRFEGDWKRFR